MSSQDFSREDFSLILNHFEERALSHEVAFGELTLEVAPSDLLDLVEDLKRDTIEMKTLVDITAVDYPQEAKRFAVVYHFLSMTLNQRLRLIVRVGEDEPLASITAIHPSANWFEREVFDMFGVAFEGHPDLRRILTDYGFEGHPLRKDFPTTGYVELRYDEREKKVVYEPVSLVQDYRQFDFLSPWEGAKYILPGDEKSADKSGT